MKYLYVLKVSILLSNKLGSAVVLLWDGIEHSKGLLVQYTENLKAPF